MAVSEQLPSLGLRAVLIFGQGVAVNGSALIQGMSDVLGATIPITGGLAGDAAAFKETWVLDHTGVHNDRLVCVGFYGESLSYSHGSAGGWAPFGPARRVTRSENNVLFELDGEPALDVYKRYLGDYAKDLPAAGLLFPLAMLGNDHTEAGLIRTILATDETRGSLTLAGDIDPEGYLRLMHASTDALVEGAEVAAQVVTLTPSHVLDEGAQSLAVLVSCVGRKLVMGGRVDEEIEAVADVFGPLTLLTGFYSNGEISPLPGTHACKLHNQTMTITRFAEV
ncbi:FIST signal transduction protein [Roseateles sp. GG27B]